jgi:alkylated DNA repair dioxygenase AlkB
MPLEPRCIATLESPASGITRPTGCEVNQQTLFPKSDHPLLNRDGLVEYLPSLFSPLECESLFGELLKTSPWQQDEVILFGQKRILSRKVAWMGDAGFTYSYSGTSKTTSPWTPSLMQVKERVELRTTQRFNSCLLNLYHDGSEGMGWHSDDEKTLGRNPVIASVSFGAGRIFKLKHRKSKEVVSVLLEQGSLLIMKGATQHHWVHTMPKTNRVTTPRINLTFRQFVGSPS